MSLFHKPTVQEQMRANEKESRKIQRDLNRDRSGLERDEKKLQEEIKKAAKQGNQQAVNILAKQLVNLRKHKTQNIAMGSKVQALSTQEKIMASNYKMGEAMKSTTAVMQRMNKVMDPQKTMETMKQFQQESMKMGMTEEMMNDTLDDMFAESGDEEEQDRVVAQVLDEIGIDIKGKVSAAPVVTGKIGDSSAAAADADLAKQLERLKNL